VHNPVSGSLSYDLGQNERVDFGVRFAPTAPGPQNCTIETGHPDCANLRVLANAIQSSSPCWVETPSIDFGIVRPGLGSAYQRLLRITSVYGQGLDGEVFSPCAGFFSGPSGTFSIAPGGSTQWSVIFRPGGVPIGDTSCVINLDRTGTSGCPIVRCTATVKNTAGTTSPQVLAFPATQIGQSRDLALTISSSSPISGTVSVPCSEFTVVGSPSYSIPANGQATFTIRYTPTAVGLHQCTVWTGSDCESVWAFGTGYVP
jgi:hypothetical protein